MSYTIKNPFAQQGQQIGLGDAVKRTISTVTGGRVQPCGKCKKRQAALNRWLQFQGTRRVR